LTAELVFGTRETLQPDPLFKAARRYGKLRFQKTGNAKLKRYSSAFLP
jgi:hypothetical protein